MQVSVPETIQTSYESGSTSDPDLRKNLYEGNERLLKTKNAASDADDANPELGPRMLQNLMQFGYFFFTSPIQWRIIEELTNYRRDVCAVLAPGFGKSLCAHYPAVATDKVVFIVNPLMSFIQEQVQALRMSDVPACVLGAMRNDHNKKMEKVKTNHYQVVYATPEFIVAHHKELLDVLKSVKIAAIVVEEAHCVSWWGHDYRWHYRELGALRDHFPCVPVLAITSSPSPPVRDDIVSYLNLRNPLVIASGFHRRNLYLEVKMKHEKRMLEDILKVIVENCGSTLIYTLSRDNAQTIAQAIKDLGVKWCEAYHAGMTEFKRTAVYGAFLRDEIKVLVTTASFGLGINKRDIRNVIHCHVPRDIESYYLEIGRAGRDGLPANCVLYYSRLNADIQESLREMSVANGFVEAKKRKSVLADVLTEYVITSECRWQFLLKHFGGNQEYKKNESTGCCDNCKTTEKYPNVKIDIEGRFCVTSDFYLLLKWVVRRCVTAEHHPILGLKNSNAEWWQDIATLLERNGFITVKCVPAENEPMIVQSYRITEKGLNFLISYESGNVIETFMDITPRMKAMVTQLRTSNERYGPPEDPKTIVAAIQQRIKNRYRSNPVVWRLIKRRNALSKRYKCAPSTILSDKSLILLSFTNLKSVKKLRNCKIIGLSEGKIKRFGAGFMTSIAAGKRAERQLKELIVTKIAK